MYGLWFIDSGLIFEFGVWYGQNMSVMHLYRLRCTRTMEMYHLICHFPHSLSVPIMLCWRRGLLRLHAKPTALRDQAPKLVFDPLFNSTVSTIQLEVPQ